MMKTLLVLMLLLPIAARAQQPRVNWKYWSEAGAMIGADVADVQYSQDCIAERACREANPFMPSNTAGMYGVSLGLDGASLWGAYELKKSGSHWWWLAPLPGIGLHVLGAVMAARIRSDNQLQKNRR